MANVFVVIAESGEYEDLTFWVCGVFSEKQRAEDLLQEKLNKKRALYEWHKTLNKHLAAIDRTKYYDKGHKGSIKLAIEESEARRKAGPEPPMQRIERGSVYEIEMEIWDVCWLMTTFEA